MKPTTVQDGRKITLYLPAADIIRLRELGAGSVSAGVRMLIQRTLDKS